MQKSHILKKIMKANKTNNYFNSSVIFILIALWIAFIFNIFLTIFVNQSTPYDNSTLIERIKPIGELYIEGDIDTAIAKPAKNQASKQRTGKEIYDTSCASCHNIGVANAPKLSNKKDWTPRIKQGIKNMIASAIKGKGAMPARGGCGNCSDTDMNKVVTYMADSIK